MIRLWLSFNLLPSIYSLAAKAQPMHALLYSTDYGRPVRKLPSLHGRKSTPTTKFLGTAEAYFVCHIGPNFQISLIYACLCGVPTASVHGLNSADELMQPSVVYNFLVLVDIKQYLCLDVSLARQYSCHYYM